MPSFLSIEKQPKLKRISCSEYEEPQFKLGEIANIAAIDASPKDIQNWTARGFLTPSQGAPRKTKLYSLKNVVEASVIGHLSQVNPFSVSSELAWAFANRAGCLLSEGYDFFHAWEANSFMLYYYTVQADGYERGVYISREDLAKVILGEKAIPGVVGSEKRFFECDDLIFRVLCNYVEMKK